MRSLSNSGLKKAKSHNYHNDENSPSPVRINKAQTAFLHEVSSSMSPESIQRQRLRQSTEGRKPFIEISEGSPERNHRHGHESIQEPIEIFNLMTSNTQNASLVKLKQQYQLFDEKNTFSENIKKPRHNFVASQCNSNASFGGALESNPFPRNESEQKLKDFELNSRASSLQTANFNNHQVQGFSLGRRLDHGSFGEMKITESRQSINDLGSFHCNST